MVESGSAFGRAGEFMPQTYRGETMLCALMNATTKSLLVATLACLISGLVFNCDFIDVRNFPECYLALPMGAISFGLFLIAKLLEKETAVYDQEHKTESASTPPGRPSPNTTQQQQRPSVA